MSFASRASSLQTYTMSLFRNAIHPEFFRIEARQRVRHGGYDFEGWIFRGGHVLRFQYGDLCVTEVITDQPHSIPERGVIATFPCAGERDHEVELNDRVLYLTSMQTETLSDHLYLGTYNEMMQHGRDCDGAMSIWSDDSGKPNLSLIDTQRYGEEFHVQGYHIRSDCGLVLRTQTIFQLRS
jgi:hypothetical protein